MRYAVVTGAAAGIGRALARRFGAAGCKVLGIDVDEPAAERTARELAGAGIDARFLIADLGTPEGVDRVLSEAAAGPPIGVFVHNAGINLVGRFAESDAERQRAVIELNLTAPMVLSAGLLREKRLARGASLVFVSSLSRFVGYPGAAGYAASKDGLASYARGLATAYAAAGLHVLTV